METVVGLLKNLAGKVREAALRCVGVLIAGEPTTCDLFLKRKGLAAVALCLESRSSSNLTLRKLSLNVLRGLLNERGEAAQLEARRAGIFPDQLLDMV